MPLVSDGSDRRLPRGEYGPGTGHARDTTEPLALGQYREEVRGFKFTDSAIAAATTTEKREYGERRKGESVKNSIRLIPSPFVPHPLRPFPSQADSHTRLLDFWQQLVCKNFSERWTFEN